MKLTFLAANTRLTKRFVKTATGVEKHSYPNVKEFTSHEEAPQSLEQFASVLRRHAALGHCLLKGNVLRPLVNESRKGSTNPMEKSDWVCLDVDGFNGTATKLMQAIGLEDQSYVIQYSASYNITSTDLRCHIFMLLKNAVAAPSLKQWLTGLNLEAEDIRNSITLTKSGHALKWPIDVTACQNDKLLYIAPPELVGMRDPMRTNARIATVNKTYDILSLHSIRHIEANQKDKHTLIKELRAAAGLTTTTPKIKQISGQSVMTNPDAAIVTDTKIDRGFVYFNINGGDSWGYYHPEGKPEYIYNFKDEPVYKTSEFLPHYWESINAAPALTPTDLRYLAFLDRRSSTYYRGTYDPTSEHLELFGAKNETQVRHFAKQHGMPLGDFIPEWDIVFDPEDTVRVDFKNQVINTFEPSVFMQQTAVERATPPPLILSVIHHALGSDEEITRYFINWLAYILQFRDRTLTAWVLHGTTGTGKGILMHKILAPLFGAKQSTMRRMEEFDSQFNSYIENNLIVCVDEMEASALFNAKGVMAKLKNFITEERVPLRTMYRTPYDVYNRTNWLFFSNQPEVVHIPKNDRRFNVGKYQPAKIDMSQKEIDSIEGELQHFHDFLLYYQVDDKAVMTPLDTESRNSMISISEASIDTVAGAILDGDFATLIDQLPSDDSYKLNPIEMTKVDAYKSVLNRIIARTDPKGACSISRDELRALFEYTVGNMPSSPNKFTSLLKHHRVHMTSVWLNDITVRGIKVHWQKPEEFATHQALLTPAKQPLRVVK